jgi:hypothetical protein
MQGGERVRGLDTSEKPRCGGVGPLEQRVEQHAGKQGLGEFDLRDAKNRGLYLREGIEGY